MNSSLTSANVELFLQLADSVHLFTAQTAGKTNPSNVDFTSEPRLFVADKLVSKVQMLGGANVSICQSRQA